MSDLGQRIYCRVIGSNVYGADTAYTNVVGPVGAGEIPVIISGSEPAIDDITPEVGETLTCTTAEADWDGHVPMTFSYQWCQAVVDEDDEVVTDENGDPVGTPIEDADSSTYEVT